MGHTLTRAELFKLLPFGLAATPASRAGGSTGYFGRESMPGIYIDGPSRAVRYSSRAPRPGCPCPAASISSIKISLVNELNLILSSHGVVVPESEVTGTKQLSLFDNLLVKIICASL